MEATSLVMLSSDLQAELFPPSFPAAIPRTVGQRNLRFNDVTRNWFAYFFVLPVY